MTTPKSWTEKRRGAESFGRWAESACAFYLRAKGYRILDRDLRLAVGEIDIVARRGGIIAFIEVKARSDGASPEVLTRRQRRRIVRAASLYLATRPRLASLTIRFDLMLLRPWRLPLHMQGAWRADE